MKKTYIILAVIIAGFIGIFLVLFGISNAPKTKTSTEPLRIGINPWIGHGLYYVAKEKGFFEKEQIAVEVIPVDDSGIGKQLIATNKLDALSLIHRWLKIFTNKQQDICEKQNSQNN